MCLQKSVVSIVLAGMLFGCGNPNELNDSSGSETVLTSSAVTAHPSSATIVSRESMSEIATANTVLLKVRSQKVECEGFKVALCLVVQRPGQTDWTYLYEDIVGFEFE